jgi:hypothetical protein
VENADREGAGRWRPQRANTGVLSVTASGFGIRTPRVAVSLPLITRL